MSVTASPVLPSKPADSAPAGIPNAEIDSSFRLPLLLVFLGAAAWLVLASVFALIASIKFHGPNFLAHSEWLTYGRVRPAAYTALAYGFCIPAALGVVTWISARLGRNALAVPLLVIGGAVVWNAGVALGVFGILSGDATGFKAIEIPRYAAMVMFMGYALLGVSNVLTYHHRRHREVYVSQWFMLAAVFWFPWILSTAILLLTGTPVRGALQAIIAWWYEANLTVVWMGAMGLAILFYLVPKVTGKELQGRYTALFAFWLLLVAGSWSGIPQAAPLPAWLPAVSTVANSLLFLLLVTVAYTVWQTTGGKLSLLWGALSLRFVLVGFLAFLAAGLLALMMQQPVLSQKLEFTWTVAGQNQLQIFGFLALILFGAIYYLLPQLVGPDIVCMKLAKAHFWLSLLGLILGPVILALGGFMEGARLQNPGVAFVDVMTSTLHFLRLSTIGELLILTGNAILLVSVLTATVKYYKARATLAYREVSAQIPTAGVKA
jgi:cytochrome c oxidase cbb3-type subunit 1